MHLSSRDLSKIKYGAGSVVCGLLVTGGSVAAKYGWLGKSAMVSVLPIAGSVAGIALISFGLLMLYQVNERRNFLASIGKAVQIPEKNHDQKKTSSSPALLSILQIGAIGIATAAGIYAAAKWVGTGNSSSSTHTGSSASEPGVSFPRAETTDWAKVMSLLGASRRQEIRLALSAQEVVPLQKEYTVNLPKFNPRQTAIPLLQRLMTDKSYKTNPIFTNNQVSSDLGITQFALTNATLESVSSQNYPIVRFHPLTTNIPFFYDLEMSQFSLANRTLGNLSNQNYSIVKFDPTPNTTQNNQNALDSQGDASFNLWKIVPLTRDLLISFGCSYLAHSISQNIGPLFTSLLSFRKRPVDSLLPTYLRFSGNNDQFLNGRPPFPPSGPSGSPIQFFGGSGELAALPRRKNLIRQRAIFADNGQQRWGEVPIPPVIKDDPEYFEIVIHNGRGTETNDATSRNQGLIEGIQTNEREGQHEVQNSAQELREAVVAPADVPRPQDVSNENEQSQSIRHKKPAQTRQEPNPVDAVWEDIPLNHDPPVNDDPPGEISIYIEDDNIEEQTAVARSNDFRLDFYTIYSLAARFFSSLLPQIKQWSRPKRDLKEIKIHFV